MSRRLGSSALFAESMDTQAIPIPSNFTPAGDLPSIQQTGVPVPPTGSSGGTLDPRPHPGIPSAIDATPSSPHSIHTNSISDARRPFDGALSANSLILCGLEPIEPSQVKRYERGRNANENTPQKRKINAFQRHFATPVSYPGWERRLHPEGARYFTKANAGASLEILTDADVSVKPTRDKIEEAATQLKSKIEGQCPELRNAQMVLEVLDEDSIGYYLVDHDNKVLFWADPYDSSDASTLHEVSVIASEEQIGHEVEAWYWQHVSLFPCHPVKRADVDKLLEYISGALFDVQTSTRSLAPYSPEDLTSMLKNLTVAKGIKEMEITGGFVAPIARLHSFFAHARFMHYHGEGCARLAAGQSVLGALSDEPTPPFWLLNLALFGRPGKSLGKLEPLIVDNVATQSLLVKFVATELSSWQTMATQCGVLITGNLAFLAVPSVIKAINDNNATQTRFLPTGGQTLKGGPPPGTHETWSLAQIFSAISTTFLLVSILVNFVLREMYNGDARDKMAEMIDLHHGQRANRGLIFRNLECLALLHSIPMAFMIWGAILASVSFVCWGFETRHPVAWLLLGLGATLLLSSVLLWLSVLYPWCCEHACDVVCGAGEALARAMHKALPRTRDPPTDIERNRPPPEGPPTENGGGPLLALQALPHPLTTLTTPRPSRTALPPAPQAQGHPAPPSDRESECRASTMAPSGAGAANASALPPSPSSSLRLRG